MRHGETWANRDRRMQGQRDADQSSHQSSLAQTQTPSAIPSRNSQARIHELSPLGQQQVIALGKRLSQTPAPSQVYASPLLRSRETVRLLKQNNATWEPQYDDRLSEIDLGIFSGLTWPEAQARYPALCQTLTTQLDWHPIPEAESPQTIHRRANHFIRDCILQNPDTAHIWIISHAGILNHLIAALMGSDRTWGIPTAPAALFEFQLQAPRWNHHRNQDGCSPGPSPDHPSDQLNTELWKILYFNDTSHYDGALTEL